MTCELSTMTLRELRDLFAARAAAAPYGSQERADLEAKAAEYQHRIAAAEAGPIEDPAPPRPGFRLFGRTWGRA